MRMAAFTMPKHSVKISKEIFVWAIIFSVLAGIFAIGLYADLPREVDTLLLITIGVALAASLAGFAFYDPYLTWARKRLWRRTTNAWKESVRTGKMPDFDLAIHLSSGGLKHLAMQIYARMGYLVIDPEVERDDGLTIKLINPEGKTEVVFCIQHPQPISIPAVQRLKEEMEQERAIQGYLWAPVGFTNEVLDWVKAEPIVLADNIGVGRFVDCVHHHVKISPQDMQ